MLKKLTISVMMVFALIIVAYSVTLIDGEWLGNGSDWMYKFMSSVDVGSDSATTVASDTTFSNVIVLAPHTGSGIGTVEFWQYESTSDGTPSDTIAVQHLIQVGVDGQDNGYVWKNYLVSDTLHTVSTRHWYEVDFAELSAYRYMRIGFIATINAGTTYVNTDATSGYCKAVFPVNPDYYEFIFDPARPGENMKAKDRKVEFNNQ